MKKGLLMGIILVFALSVAGCSTTKQNAADKSTLIIGIDDTFAPMGFKKDGEIVGFDVDLAIAVAKILDKKLEFQNIDWDLKESELQSGNIDLIWNGYSITEQRKKQVLFSDPYMDNTQMIITTATSTIKTKADLAGKSVAVQKNSSAYDAIMKDKELVKKLKGGKVTQFDINNDCFMDLKSKRSDAIVVDETLARYYIKQQAKDTQFVYLKDTFGNEQYAVAMRKSEHKLQKQINGALQTLKENGTFAKIKAKWFV